MVQISTGKHVKLQDIFQILLLYRFVLQKHLNSTHKPLNHKVEKGPARAKKQHE